MLPDSLDVSVTSPGTGSITVEKKSSVQYRAVDPGTNYDFCIIYQTATNWTMLLVPDLGAPETWVQVTPNTADPEGAYKLSSGAASSATVAAP